jgi:hypothetical protein
MLEAGQHAQERGLAAARGAKKREELAAPYRKRNAIDGGDRAEMLGHLPDLDHLAAVLRHVQISPAELDGTPRRRNSSASMTSTVENRRMLEPRASIPGSLLGKRSCPNR